MLTMDNATITLTSTDNHDVEITITYDGERGIMETTIVAPDYESEFQALSDVFAAYPFVPNTLKVVHNTNFSFPTDSTTRYMFCIQYVPQNTEHVQFMMV